MNYDASPKPFLAVGTRRMGEQLRSFLEASGYEVVVPSMSSTLRLWQACASEVGGIATKNAKKLDEGKYHAARSELVRRTLDRHPADGVVAATVLVRKGRYVSESLDWDGTIRAVPFDMGDSNMPVLFTKGHDFGTSLRTAVFDRTGTKIFERYVGLEPIHEYKIDKAAKYMERTRRKDLFEEAVLLEAGIALSFQPWLIRPSIGAE